MTRLTIALLMKLLIVAVTIAALGFAQEEATKKVPLSVEDSLKMSLYGERLQAAQEAISEAFRIRQEHITAVCAKAKIELNVCVLAPSGKDTWVAQVKAPTPATQPAASAPGNGKRVEEAKK